MIFKTMKEIILWSTWKN